MENSTLPDINYGALLDRLIDRFEPARRIWPVNRRLMLWLTLEFLIMALVVVVEPRADLLAALQRPWYAAQVGLFAIIGTAAGALALRSAIPGLEAGKNQLVPVVLTALLAIIVIASAPAAAGITLGRFVSNGVPCLVCTTLFALAAWFPLFLLVRRGAALSGDLSGALVGAAAFSFAFAASRLGCPLDGPLHILTWHVMPVAAGTLLSTFVGLRWLNKSRLRRVPRAA